MNTIQKMSNGVKKVSTLFLKAVIVILALASIAIVIAIVYPYFQGRGDADFHWFAIDISLATIPFLFALLQAWKLLKYIDQNSAFSRASIKALQNIKYTGVIIAIMFAAGLRSFYIIADQDDAPGVMLIGLIFTVGPIIVAVFAAVLQKLLQSGIEIKSENDLTV